MKMPDLTFQYARIRRRAFSLVEVLAVVTILGIVAAIVIPRIAGTNTVVNRNACFVNQGDIEAQVRIWRRHKGVAPALGLGDIGADPDYFPSGLPACPVDGTPYAIDATGAIVGHAH